MATRTNFELFDIVDATGDFSISATDLEGQSVQIISSSNARRYINRKYATRKYSVLTGLDPATIADAKSDFKEDYRLWILNRQHNIDRMYQAMFDRDYNPIENVFRHEVETIDATDATTYGRVDTESGTNSTTYGKKDTESGTTTVQSSKTGSDDNTITNNDAGSDEISKAGAETHEIEKAGFNAPSTYSNDTKDTLSYTSRKDTTTYGKRNTVTEDLGHTESGTDSTSHGKVVTESGTDSLQFGHKNTASGSDSTDHDSERELNVNANVGVSSAQDLIEQEINLRMKSLAEMLIDNFINDYTYYS